MELGITFSKLFNEVQGKLNVSKIFLRTRSWILYEAFLFFSSSQIVVIDTTPVKKELLLFVFNFHLALTVSWL